MNEHRYYCFRIPKGNGKFRKITAPNKELKAEQILFLQHLYTVSPHDAAHGFAPGRSIVTNASPHVGKTVVMNVDIKDFFGSTKVKAVRHVLERFYGFTGAELDEKIHLCSYRGALPQGAPTSPHIANMAMYDFDVWLQSQCDDMGLSYTRYADDLTVSGDEIPKGFLKAISNKLYMYGYRIAPGKVHFNRRHQRQMVTGLVVNEKVHLPRTTRRWIRALLHSGQVGGLTAMLSQSGKEYKQIQGIIGLQALYDRDTAQKHLAQLKAIKKG